MKTSKAIVVIAGMLALIVAACLMMAPPSMARMNFLSVDRDTTSEMLSRMPVEITHLIRGSRYLESELFFLFRNERPGYCNGGSCLSVIVLKCPRTNCPYVASLAGEFFAFDDVIRPNKIGGASYLRLFSFCKAEEGETADDRVAGTWLVNRRAIIVATSTPDNCFRGE